MSGSKSAFAALRINSPLLYSTPLSKSSGLPIYLKLDCFQPSGSFKDRGMSHLCQQLKEQGYKKFISSSGGNAGHSAAMCGRILGIPVHVIVPKTTKPLMLEKIKAQGAQVKVHGENWNQADDLARKLVKDDKNAAYISPYDHPLLWEGHSTIIDEIAKCGYKPGAIIASVGGGGLLCGIYEGLNRHKWGDVTVIGAETNGAASFYESFQAGKLIRLPAITSVATSLGALEVTRKALEYSRNQPTQAQVVSDREAVNACRQFLDDHRILIEPACGAALALVYEESSRNALSKFGDILVVVCGGSSISRTVLNDLEQQVGLV